MGNFSFSSMWKLTGFSIKNNRKQIFGWCFAIFSIMFLYTILFPSVKDLAQAKLDAMPESLLQLVGMDELSDMSSFISFFGMIFNLVLIAISIFAASFTGKLISSEEKTGTIEFLYSLEVSRIEIYVSRLAASFISVLVVTCCGIAAAGIAGAINGGETFILEDFLLIVKTSGFIPFFFLGLSLMFVGVSKKIGASSYGNMAVLVLYLLGFLSSLLGENAQWLGLLSPFETLSPTNAVEMDGKTLVAFGVNFALFIIFIIAGGAAYKRRDFNI